MNRWDEKGGRKGREVVRCHDTLASLYRTERNLSVSGIRKGIGRIIAVLVAVHYFEDATRLPPTVRNEMSLHETISILRIVSSLNQVLVLLPVLFPIDFLSFVFFFLIIPRILISPLSFPTPLVKLIKNLLRNTIQQLLGINPQ